MDLRRSIFAEFLENGGFPFRFHPVFVLFTCCLLHPTEPIRHFTSLGAMSSLTVAQFPCLSDNYGYLIHDEATGQTAAIDTPCATTYKKELQKRGWSLTHILNTHQYVLSLLVHDFLFRVPFSQIGFAITLP
jgi:hypothetical protein